MRHGPLHGPRASRRLVGVLAAGLVTTLTLAAALSTGAAHAQTQAGPTNTAPPTVTGTATVGQTLNADPGTWAGKTPITFSYQWQRCDSSGNNCTSIVGETTSRRTLVSDDVGHRLRVRVRAANSDGSNAVTSAASATVAATGAQGAGQHQGTGDHGIRRPGPDAVRERRQMVGRRSDHVHATSGTAATRTRPTATAIAGETTSHRTLSADDAGHRLRIRVTASNGAGSSGADSNATSVVTGTGGSGAPVSTALPVISGDALRAPRSSPRTGRGRAPCRSRSRTSGCAAPPTGTRASRSTARRRPTGRSRPTTSATGFGSASPRRTARVRQRFNPTRPR